MHPDELAKVTKRQLSGIESACPRRLHLDHSGQRGNRLANRRYRVLGQIAGDAALAHTELCTPTLRHFPGATDLFPEERAVYDAAARWYVELFGDRAARADDLDTEPMETTVERLEARLVGPAGLAVCDDRGVRELRLLGLRGSEVSPPTLDAVDIRFALLRRVRWARVPELRVVRADLLGGTARAAVFDVEGAWPELEEWLSERVGAIRARADRSAAVAGTECGACAFVAGCGALR